MGLADELGDKLAIDVLKVVNKLGDDQIINDVAKVLGASSTPTEEAFLSAIRTRMAEQRAREFLRDYVRDALAKKEAEAKRAAAEAAKKAAAEAAQKNTE